MKMGERSEIRLDKALDILVSYQAYCLSTGYGYRSFAEFLYDESCIGIIDGYYSNLNREWLDDESKEDPVECAAKIIQTIPYVATKANLADAFILLNRNLKRGNGRLCILSWYDLQTIIGLYSKKLEYVTKLLFGTVAYGVVDENHMRIVRNIMSGSVRDVKTFYSMSDLDCPLNAMALWLLYNDCCIDDRGIKSRFLSEYDNTHHMRDDVVFTKVLWKFSLHSYTYYAKNYTHDCIDKAAALLFSLPAHCEYIQEIPEESTRKNILDFMNKYGGYESDNVKLSRVDGKRAIAFKDKLILSSYNSENNLYVISIVSGSRAYVVNVEGNRVLSSSGLNEIGSDYLNTVGKTFDYVLKNDGNNIVESLIDSISE